MKWIGLTGGIACGKSTVSRILKENSLPVIDADEIAKEVVKPGSPGLRSVTELFGNEFLLPDGSLDRRKLGQFVFGNSERLRQLESVLHPLVQQETRRRRQALEKLGEPVAIYDIPLLFETHAQDQFDAVIVVTATPEQQKERLRMRNNWTDEEISRRIAAQMPLALKEQQADFVVHNDQDEAHLHKELRRLLQWIETFKKNL